MYVLSHTVHVEASSYPRRFFSQTFLLLTIQHFRRQAPHSHYILIFAHGHLQSQYIYIQF